MQSIELADKIFKTCFALHNFLLEANCIDILWEESTEYNFNIMILRIIIKVISFESYIINIVY